MTIKAPQQHHVGLSEVCTFAISLDGRLDAGESLIGSPSVTEVTALSATIDNVEVSADTLTINGQSVAAGRAVTGRVSGWSGAGTCTLLVTCGTDGTPAQTRGGQVDITVVDDGSSS